MRLAPTAGKKREDGEARWLITGRAAILGILLGFGAANLGLQAVPPFRTEHLALVGGLVGAMLGNTRLRSVLWLLGLLECLAFLILGYTPLVVPRINAWVRSNPLRPVEAVVVLSSGIKKDGSLTASSQNRLLHAYQLVGQKKGNWLVLTRLMPPEKSYLPAVRDQMRQLGMSHPIEETGAVTDTHDEAVQVARLARARGWDTVILVTDPLHTRRAAATFEHTGLSVICSPCPSLRYDLSSLHGPAERLGAFREWIREVVGYHTYRLRGWI